MESNTTTKTPRDQAIENHEAAKARYAALTSSIIRDEAAIAAALVQHRITRYEVEKWQRATAAEGFRF